MLIKAKLNSKMRFRNSSLKAGNVFTLSVWGVLYIPHARASLLSVSEMTDTVSSGTINFTILYYSCSLNEGPSLQKTSAVYFLHTRNRPKLEANY